jgi:hypothetical protein
MVLCVPHSLLYKSNDMYIYVCITIAGFNLAQSKIYLETCLYALRVIMIAILSVLCCHGYAGDRCV